MSNADSSFSKSQLDLLKQFKKQISTPQPVQSTKAETQPEQKPTSQQTVSKTQDSNDDADLFKKALLGVKKIDNSNIAKIERPDIRKKIDWAPG